MRCQHGGYFHVTAEGTPAYAQRHRYAGDFRDGSAPVQRGNGRHSHIDAGYPLHRPHPLSMADAALHWGRESDAAWSEAGQFLRAGESAFRGLYRGDLFDWLGDRPEDLRDYHRAMAGYARHDYQALAGLVDFGIHDHILDVGGGAGELAFSLLRACPDLTATVMDRPEVISGVAAPADVAGRCSLAGCDFFEKWPVGSDAVVLSRVLHDWPDHGALRILRRAREAMSTGGALYLVELTLDDASGAGGMLDLNMLVMTGGGERTVEQFRALLGQSGFELVDIVETGSVNSLLRARAV